MTRMTAKDFSPELLELYDFYAHGKISKRDFLHGLHGFIHLFLEDFDCLQRGLILYHCQRLIGRITDSHEFCRGRYVVFIYALQCTV